MFLPRKRGLHLFGLLLFAPAMTQAANKSEINQAISKGVNYLQTHLASVPVDHRALATLAILKAGDEKARAGVLAGMGGGFRDGGYAPTTTYHRTYEAAVTLMALCASDPVANRPQIDAVVKWLIDTQIKEADIQLPEAKDAVGAWDYERGIKLGFGASKDLTGDVSMTQYALLGLWEAAANGVPVPTEVWDKALDWLVRSQKGNGWSYWADIPKVATKKDDGHYNTIDTMSVAGGAAVLICQMQLPIPKTTLRERSAEEVQFLIPYEENLEIFKPRVKPKDLEASIKKASSHVAGVAYNKSPTWSHNRNKGAYYYFLYCIERYAAVRELKEIGGKDWYDVGANVILERQNADGSWHDGDANFPPEVDTSFALLFLGKSTNKTFQKIKANMLTKGLMVGGRGMPAAGSIPDDLEARQKARFRGAMAAPAADLLNVLVDPNRLGDVQSAAAALETVDPNQLIKAAKGRMKDLRLLTNNPHAPVRRAALTALARTKDYRVTPLLIRGLKDADANVYAAARDGLIFLSRKLGAFGLPETNPSAEQIQAASDKFNEWFASLRIDLESEQEFDEPL